MVFTPSPERSQAHSTISTPPRRSLTGEMQLTPRNKVQALLDTFDSDSDKENNTAKGLVDVKVVKQQRPGGESTRPVGLFSAGSSEDELASAIVEKVTTPRQRKIDRLQPENDSNTSMQKPTVVRSYGLGKGLDLQDSADDNDDDSDGIGAYERIKQQLWRESSPVAGSVGSQRASQKPATAPTGSQVSSRRASPSSTRKDDQSAITKENPATADSDSSVPSAGRSRLQELVARKREQREALEKAAHHSSAEEDEEDFPQPLPKPKKAKRQAVTVESEGDTDEEAGKRFTQQARPTRKASKKAIEEMNKETQRLSRNMQLTHEAKTKTKFTTADLFKRLGYRQPQVAEVAPVDLAAISSSSAPATSDVEPVSESHTPPSSPPSLGGDAGSKGTKDKPQNLAIQSQSVANADVSSDEELPTMEEMLAEKRQPSSVSIFRQSGGDVEAEAIFAKPSLKKFGKLTKPQMQDGSDDDLEIIETTRSSRIAALDNMPAKKSAESKSLRSLRALAHLSGPDKMSKRLKGSMTSAELRAMLQSRARDQARIEKAEKIQALRDKGIIVQTDEEKEKEQMQIENMLERARLEAEELRKREKEAAKREGKEEGAKDGLPDSEDEDEDYDGSDEDEDVELSGSEEGEEEEEVDEEDDKIGSKALIDHQADEDASGDEEEEEKEEEAEDEEPATNDDSERETLPQTRTNRPRRKAVVLSDDEDDSTAQTPVKALPSAAVETPKPSLVNAFGFDKIKSPALGLSQVFGGTMAETQTQGDSTLPATDSQQDSLAFLRGLPVPDMPSFGEDFDEDNPGVAVQDSQAHQPEAQADEATQDSPLFSIDSLTQRPFDETQSEMPDATQDGGFETTFSPVRGKAVGVQDGSHSTVETVLLDPESPEYRKKGRLRRGREQVEVEASQIEVSDAASENEEPAQSTNVFMVMKNAARKPAQQADFDKKKSDAKDMVEEQAEESDDEYAGLGGVDDDASDGELDEETKKMIDDESNEKVNERDVAAYFADKERADDEKLLSRLYKDIHNGGFRRKRGADMDLLDSDDEEEAMARRRAAKQREFAKMRKALLADEKLGKIAENPKQQAFLQAVEDYGNDDDFMFLEMPEDGASQGSTSQGPLLSTSGNAGKRKRSNMPGEDAQGSENRPPPNTRRTHKAFKPATLTEVRTTLSEMIGEPESILETQPDNLSDEDERDEGLEDDDDDDDDLVIEKPAKRQSRSRSGSPVPAPTSPIRRRRTADPAHSAVIDRMALKRASSSNASHSGERLAFQAPSLAGTGGFKVPSLLRRATTNASTGSNDSVTERAAAAGTGKETVKMGGSKKSSVNYYVREKERRAKVEELVKARQEERLKVGRMRRNGMGLGSLTGGSFE